MTTTNNNSVVILSAVRTAIGGFGGSLKNFTPAQLGTLCAKEAIARAKLSPEEIGTCVVGKVIHNGPKDAYLSRVIGLDAGLPLAAMQLHLIGYVAQALKQSFKPLSKFN